MPEAEPPTRIPAHPTDHWGFMASDPWMDIDPGNAEWPQAVKRAWLRDGGSEEDFHRLFGFVSGERGKRQAREG